MDGGDFLRDPLPIRGGTWYTRGIERGASARARVEDGGLAWTDGSVWTDGDIRMDRSA